MSRVVELPFPQIANDFSYHISKGMFTIFLFCLFVMSPHREGYNPSTLKVEATFFFETPGRLTGSGRDCLGVISHMID